MRKKTGSFEVCSLQVRSEPDDSPKASFKKASWGKVVQIAIPIFGGTKFERQHRTELIAYINSGTWQRKAGSGMRIEISEWNYASLDVKRESDSDDESNSGSDDMGFFGMGMFSGFRNRKPKGPQLRKTRAAQFKFQHVRDAVMTEVKTATEKLNSDSAINSSDADCTEANMTKAAAHVTIALDCPLRCFEEPREAQDHFMRPARDFVFGSRHLTIGFASTKKASDFLAELRKGTEESRRQKKNEEWAACVMRFNEAVLTKQYEQREIVRSVACAESLFSLAPADLATMRAEVDKLDGGSFARKAVLRWNMVPPGTLHSERCFASVIVGACLEDEQAFDVRHAKMSNLDILWRRYYELRDHDEKELLADKKKRNEGDESMDDEFGEWDTGDGQVPRRKRYDFLMKLRRQLAKALVSTRFFSASEALEISQGLFLHKFYVCEDGGPVPRTVEVSVRLYSHIAEPSAIDLHFENHCRARMTFNEQFNSMHAELHGLAAVRDDVRKGLITENKELGGSVFLRRAMSSQRDCTNGEVLIDLPNEASNANGDPLSWLFASNGIASRTIFRQSMDHEEPDQKEYAAPAEQLKCLLAAVVGELHPSLHSQAMLGRKLLVILCRACGLYTSPVKGMPYSHWAIKRKYGKNRQMGAADGMITDGEETHAAFRALQPTFLACPYHRAALSCLPAAATSIVLEFLREPLKPLRPCQLLHGVTPNLVSESRRNESIDFSAIWRKVSAEHVGSPSKAVKALEVDSDDDSKFYDSSENEDDDEEQEEEEEEREEEEDATEDEGGVDSSDMFTRAPCQDGTELAIKYWEQEEEERFEIYNKSLEGPEGDSIDDMIAYEEAHHLACIHKKIAMHKHNLKNASDQDNRDFFSWKLAKYKAKLQSVVDGWMVDPSGSEGTSWCSSDLDEKEPTEEELAEQRRKLELDREAMAECMKEMSEKSKVRVQQVAEMRARSPDRMKRIDEKIAKEEADRKAALSSRKAKKQDTLNKLKELQPELWLNIMKDRKNHREKRLRMGRSVGKKYGNIDELK